MHVVEGRCRSDWAKQDVCATEELCPPLADLAPLPISNIPLVRFFAKMLTHLPQTFALVNDKLAERVEAGI